MEAHRIRDSEVNSPLMVIMDANFLMMPVQFNVDLFGELARLLPVKHELVVPEGVIHELKVLSEKGGLKEKRAAKVALEIAGGMRVVSLKGADTDEAMLSMAGKNTVICTNDRKLRIKVIKKGGMVIFLKQKKILEIEGGRFGVS